MKQIKVALILCCIIALMGCRAHYPVAQETGKADVAYILIVRNHKADSKVTVTLTNPDVTFEAQTVKSKKANRRGYQYQVGTGTRGITVKGKNGEILYQSKIFLQGQEVKEIDI